jgi:hypothetical protein
MNDKSKRYWFPAKRYGWGWGFPSAWQGWAVFIVFIAVVSILPFLINPNDNMPGFLIAMTAAAAILVGICYVKGEAPKWRWGNEEDKNKPNKTEHDDA